MADSNEQSVDPGIVGTDGFPPVYQPLRRFATFREEELFMGNAGKNKYVGNVRDIVYKVVDNKIIHKEIVYVDESTKIPTLRILIDGQEDTSLTDEELLLGRGPGTDSDTYRIFLDKSVRPFYAAIEARLDIRGSMASVGRLYKGADVYDETQRISLLYDSSGNFLGNDVPLQVVDRQGNVAVKIMPPFHTLADLEDGERVTALFLSDEGGQISTRQLTVVNSGFIYKSDKHIRYVTGISLRTDYLSSSSPKVIDFPIGTTQLSMNLRGVVHYSNGDEVELPVDGTKFEFYGLENFLATSPGKQFSGFLKYKLSDEEVHFGGQVVGSERFFQEEYKIRTLVQDGAYSVKLFAYPNWIDQANGYRMEYFLMNLDRSICQRVTPHVRLGENSPAFEPLSFGIKQNLNVQLDLNKAIPSFKSHLHSQIIGVSLITAGGEAGTNWRVEFDPGQNPQFGVGNYAEMVFVNANLKRVKLHMGISKQSDWLERLYRDSKPIMNVVTEDKAPDPTHFAIVTNAARTEHQLSEWRDVFDLGQEIYHGHTLYIEFFRRTMNNDLRLGIAGIPLRQVAAFTS